MNSKPELTELIDCRICKSRNLLGLFELAPTPPGDIFFPKHEDAVRAMRYPLRLGMCQDCSYVFLKDTLEPEISYSNYLYESKVTVGLEARFLNLVEDIASTISLSTGSIVVDIGCNDGTLLDCFSTKEMNPIGVEPSSATAKLARQKGFPVFNEYFSQETAQKIKSLYGAASVITASYMYANIDDLWAFTQNVRTLLADDGIFVIQTGYHPAQFKAFHYDYIYHEHFSYFSVTVLQKLMEFCDLKLIDAKINSLKGGSVTLFAQHKYAKRHINNSIERIKVAEDCEKIDSAGTYIKFGQLIDQKRKKLVDFLTNKSRAGATIVGYGASHSTTTLLHHFDIGNVLSYIVDDNERKHGLFSPGYGLRVFPSEAMIEEMPDYVLILAWQHQETIIERNQYLLDRGVRFVIPLPDIQIIGGGTHPS